MGAISLGGKKKGTRGKEKEKRSLMKVALSALSSVIFRAIIPNRKS